MAKGKWFYSKTRYKTQKRDRYGKWTTGGISTKPARRRSNGVSATGSYKGKKRSTKKYAAYQARLASEKKAKRRATAKKVAIGAAAVGLVAAGGYVAVKHGGKIKVPTMRAGKKGTTGRPGVAPKMLGAAPVRRQRGNKNSAPMLGTVRVPQVRQKMLMAAPVVAGHVMKRAPGNSVKAPRIAVYKGKEKTWVDPQATIKKVNTLKAGPKKGKAAKDESPDIWTDGIPVWGTPGQRGKIRQGDTTKGRKTGRDVKAGPAAVKQVKKATTGTKVRQTATAKIEGDWQQELRTMTREERRQWREMYG